MSLLTIRKRYIILTFVHTLQCFPWHPRIRTGQDMDFDSLSAHRSITKLIGGARLLLPSAPRNSLCRFGVETLKHRMVESYGTDGTL
jgi:hypothetical protein